MANIEAKIVLTGGPCAGKTSALARIEEYFTELGYKVLIVSESATELIKGGVKPFGDKSLKTFDFQDIILKYQLQKELLYDEIANRLSSHDKCIILYDRGLMDNSAYISKVEFQKLLTINNLSRLDLMDRYDMVLHLVTAADGASEYYTLENNAARSEGIEEAISLDGKTMRAWRGHRNLHIIDNTTDFDEKINRAIDSIHNLLGNPSSLRYQKKYLIDADILSNEFFSETIGIKIEQTYLGSDSYERRLRKRTLDGEETYYFTVQKQDNAGGSKVVVDKKISKKDYYRLLSLYPEKRSITKMRYCFIYKKQHFRLDIFEDGAAILETDSNIVSLPKEIVVKQEITCDFNFYNTSLATNQKAKKKLIS